MKQASCTHLLLPNATWWVFESPVTLLLRPRWERQVAAFGVAHAMTFRRASYRKGWKRAWQWEPIGADIEGHGLAADGWQPVRGATWSASPSGPAR